MKRVCKMGLAAAVLAVTACGGSSSGTTTTPPVSSAAWTGTMTGASATESGRVSLTFASPVSSGVLVAATFDAATATTIAATGVLKLVGNPTPVSLVGSYVIATHTFTISGSGGGGTYLFTGTVGTSGITGNYTGPLGAGTFLLVAGDLTSVTVLCGTYSGTSSGNWNLVLTGTTAIGLAWSGSDATTLSGTVSGLPLTPSSSLNLTYPAGGGMTGSATMTSAAPVSGVWHVPASTPYVESGTWTTTGC